MRRSAVVIVVLVLAALALPTAAWAGHPHFVGDPTLTISDNTVTVSAKEAGLGDEPQIHVELRATALCINRGGNHPRAVNKTGVATDADVPVQNGKSDYTLSGTAVFSPSCSPPMTVEFRNIALTDTTNNLVFHF